jgi:O-acetyl-ADP-ribose deacetylase (regulator of RNase III)
MPTTFSKGDLFATPGVRAYAHGCTTNGTMDAGVAVAFKKRFPRMFEDYAARCADGRFHLGDVIVWSEGDEVVYNLGIQEHWKTKARVPALSRALRRMVQLAEHASVARIGLPRIGAGLGGIDWPRVKSVLAEVGAETKVELVVFEQFVRARADGDGSASPGEAP